MQARNPVAAFVFFCGICLSIATEQSATKRPQRRTTTSAHYTYAVVVENTVFVLVRRRENIVVNREVCFQTTEISAMYPILTSEYQ